MTLASGGSHKSWGEIYVQLLFWLGSGLQNAAEYRQINN